jgi:hypothetical protein
MKNAIQNNVLSKKLKFIKIHNRTFRKLERKIKQNLLNKENLNKVKN